MEGPRADAASLAAIRRLIDERYNDDVRARVHQYAAHRAALLRRSGQPVTATDVEELAHDAVAGLWLGTHAWDPRSEDLVDQLCAIIRRRTSA